MNTLAGIEAAAVALPSADQERLLHFLTARLRTEQTTPAARKGRRGFPVSPGRERFTSEDVARAEARADHGQ